jgi:uracil-DNA glycosylase
VIRLTRADGDESSRTTPYGIAAKELEFARLVATHAEAGEVVTLHPEPYTATQLRSSFERRGKSGQSNARHAVPLGEALTGGIRRHASRLRDDVETYMADCQDEPVPTTDWNPILRAEFDEPYWAELQSFVADERTRGAVYPPAADVFAALHLTSYADTKVVILGQDPYHGAGQAHGLCFSVRPGVAVPPSLRNVYQELKDDLGCDIPKHGNLEHWARQGVLLLNTTLTVRAGQAASHQGKGWERFTDRVIGAVNDKTDRVVFLLWGAPSRKKKTLIDASRHTIIESAHPSPLSAHNGFFGSRPFSRANTALREAGRDPIDWQIS